MEVSAEKFNKDPFGQRIKEYESASEKYLDKTKYTIVRIDGHDFSKWTKGFTKPFDEFIVRAISETSKALMDEFKAVVAYSQSDEITLILLPDDNLIYSGRIQKITSLMASFASMTFNELVREELISELKRGIFGDELGIIRKELLKSKIGKAFFDCRVFQVDSRIEAFNSLLWRTHDCKRNSKNVFAQQYFTHKVLQGMTSEEIVTMCDSVLGHRWSDLPDKYKYGVIWKKESYMKDIPGEVYKMDVPCIRTRFKEITTELIYSELNVDFVLCKNMVQ
jgi:tRNA(His) 5'-end guanylyltransferase